MTQLQNRVTNHWRTRSRASVAAVTATSGVLIGSGLAARNPVLRLVAAGSGAAVAIGTLLDYTTRGQKEALADSRALWALAAGMDGTQPVQPLGGWALGPEAVAFVARWAHEHQSGRMVELGPGASTVALDRLLPSRVQMWGVEHDPNFVRSVGQSLSYHRTRDVALIGAPLVDGWYSMDVLERSLPDQIDILIVDGPPNGRGSGAREPALPNLRDRLAPGALVIVDDTARRDEREMAMRWVSRFGLLIAYRGHDFLALQIPREEET